MTVTSGRYSGAIADPFLPSLLLSLPGTELPDAMAQRLRDGLGGIILFARNVASPEQLRELCERIREANPEALIALDEEGGEVTRLEATGGSSWPGARVLGTVDDLALTERSGREIALALARAGANVNLAPVADVATSVLAPVIGNRSFGSDPAHVGRHVAAFVRGSQAAGVAACAKHFPGHGATGVDSHLDLPVIELDRATLLADHVAPFADAIAAGVGMLMSAHAVYPCLDDRPATVSPAVLQELARTQLGFEGVIVTDALTMGAISTGIGVAAGAVAALAAGADLLCVDSEPDGQAEVIAALGHALASGELRRERVEQAAERVRRLAARFAPDAGATHGGPDAGDAAELGLQAARRALRAGDAGMPDPLTSAPYVVEASIARTGIGDVRSRLLDALRRRDPRVDGVAFTPDEVPSAEAVLAAAGERPIVIGSRDAHRRPDQRALIAAVLTARPDAVVVGLGSDADGVLAPGRFLPARGAAPPNVDAVAEALLAGDPAASA